MWCRLQLEMQKYLSLKQVVILGSIFSIFRYWKYLDGSFNESIIFVYLQEGDSAETQKKVMFCFRAMSRCFAEPAEAEEKFQILDQLKDSNIWKLVTQLLDPNTSSLQASSSRVKF